MPDTIEEFRWDVFLSHSDANKDIVRDIANRLKSDGVRVWFDEWEIQPGDSIPAKIENGLEHSRVLVLCMSKAAFGSDWAQLESHTFRFKDPLNHNRRFIPLRLDGTEPKGSLAQFSYVDWRNKAQRPHQRLVDACKKKEGAPNVECPAEQGTKAEFQLDLETTGHPLCFASSSDYRRVLTGHQQSLRLWEIKSGRQLAEFSGHKAEIWSVAWSKSGELAYSGDATGAIIEWDIPKRTSRKFLLGHSDAVFDLAVYPGQRHLLSAGGDRSVRFWDVQTGACKGVLRGHSRFVICVCPLPRRHLISGGEDRTIRLWNVRNHKCLRVFEGHTGSVSSLASTKSGKHVLSGGWDNDLRFWDVNSGKCLWVLSGHSAPIESVRLSANERYAVSASLDRTMRLWDLDLGRCVRQFVGHYDQIHDLVWDQATDSAITFGAEGSIRAWDVPEFQGQDQVSCEVSVRPKAVSENIQYTNAKVLLVGNSAAGKTGLSNRLALDNYKETDSTVGAWATQWKLPLPAGDVGPVPTGRDEDATDDESGSRPVGTGPTVEREVWLWDFGGQADQRLIHQLYMDQTQVAALVFDPQKDDVFETLGQWDRDLSRADKDKADRDRMTKLLVAGRCDAGGLRVARRQIDDFVKERGYADYVETSAKTKDGCEELKQAIIDGIKWENIPWRSSPVLFKRLKDEIIELKDEGRAIMRFNELREVLALRMNGEDTRFTDAELKAVVGLLAGPGVVWELAFGTWILLRPELINVYGQAVVRTLQQDDRELGSISEERVLHGELTYPPDFERLSEDAERIVLLAAHRLLLHRGFCLKEPTERGAQLVFPSFARRDRPDKIECPSTLISYDFEGFLDDIYATLVVRLRHTEAFELQHLWNGAADFKSLTGKDLGIVLNRKPGGAAELLVHFDPEIPTGEMMLFSKYVHEHLLKRADERDEVNRLRHWLCGCGESVENRKTAMRRIKQQGRAASIICVECEEQIPLWDDLEEAFADPKLVAHVQQLERKADAELEAEAEDRSLVGEVVSTVRLANQTCRELASLRSIDMEIEFADDNDQPTGQYLYLVLCSGDRQLEVRKSDGAEMLKVAKADREVWMRQDCPVLLLHRSDEGHVRWMEVRDHLKQITEDGRKQVRKIEFKGNRFDVMTVRRWRDHQISDRMDGEQSSLELWQERLEHLRREEAINSDPAAKFTLAKLINEAQQKVQDLT